MKKKLQASKTCVVAIENRTQVDKTENKQDIKH